MCVISAVDSLAKVVETSFLDTAVIICSANLDHTFVILAEAMAVLASGNIEAHGMTSAFNNFACISFTITELVSCAVGVVSAFLFLARVLIAFPAVVVGLFAIGVRIAVNLVADIVKADGILAILSAVSIISALNRGTIVKIANICVLVAKVLAVIMRQAIDVNTLVVILCAATDLFVTAVFSFSAVNIDTYVSGADFLFPAVGVIGTVNTLASVTVASLLESAMSIRSALLFLTLIVLAQAVSLSAVKSEDSVRENVARGVANALDFFAYSIDLVAFSNAIVGGAVGVICALSIDTIVLDTSLLVSAISMSDASDLYTFVVCADFAVQSITVAVLSALLFNADVVLAQMFIGAERVASTLNSFARVSRSIANFRN